MRLRFRAKRLYYEPTGRGSSRKARTKVSLSEPHLLQRLVYIESEEYEKPKELAARDRTSLIQETDPVIHFIKHLVRITTRRNSFYVTLGLCRLLHCYTSPETMTVYGLVVQDPERVRDDYYYRSRKAVLLRELKERFGDFVQLTRGPRREERFQALEDSSRHAGLVRECLTWFTPWTTACVVPERFDPFTARVVADLAKDIAAAKVRR